MADVRIIRSERDLKELSDELREADRRAGPSPTSRDWFPCSVCRDRGRGEVGCRARDQGPINREFWDCPTCGAMISTLREPKPANGLTRWQWSIVRHLQCGIMGHRMCLPDVWLNELVVSEGGRVLTSPMFGRLELRWLR